MAVLLQTITVASRHHYPTFDINVDPINTTKHFLLQVSIPSNIPQFPTLNHFLPLISTIGLKIGIVKRLTLKKRGAKLATHASSGVKRAPIKMRKLSPFQKKLKKLRLD